MYLKTVAFFSCLMILSAPGLANERTVYGVSEKARLADLDLDVPAKLDTGAAERAARELTDKEPFDVLVVGGVSGGFVALSIGFFNSIMFPVIFTLTLERSTARAEATSGFLCTAIVGGAFLPLLVGAVSDASSYTFAFIVPAACYVVILAFGWAAGRAPAVPRAPDDAAEIMAHGH